MTLTVTPFLRNALLLDAVGSAAVGILLLGLVQPNMLGTLFVAAQALAVALFTLLQWLAIRAQPAIASH
jgi:hypothetical protein